MAKYTNEEYYQNHLKKNGIEKILCAAVWYKNAKLLVDIPENRNPFNITEGTVICGHRHPNCMWTYLALTGEPADGDDDITVQGFLTNCNRFVDRIEAARLASNAGQTTQKLFHNGKWHELYSEDLY